MGQKPSTEETNAKRNGIYVLERLCDRLGYARNADQVLSKLVAFFLCKNIYMGLFVLPIKERIWEVGKKGTLCAAHMY